jgi:hypothetical protein
LGDLGDLEMRWMDGYVYCAVLCLMIMIMIMMRIRGRRGRRGKEVCVDRIG